MAQLRTSMIIDLAGNLAGRASQFLGSMQRLGQGGSRSMQVLQRSVHAAGQGLDRLGNRYTALLTGAAGIGAIKQMGDLQERLSYLGIQASASDKDISKLNDSILNVANAPDIRVDPSGILEGVEVIVEKLGDLGLAKDNLRNIGLVMRATGAAGRDAGDMIANFREKFNLRQDEVLPALDVLVKQGKAGAFTLKDLATQGNRVTAAYGAMGRKGLKAVVEMGAVLQVFRKSTGSSEETTTAFKNFFSDIMEPAHQKVLKANGIQIWDPVALKKGKKEIRSVIDIIDEILRKSKGDPEKLAKVFGMQSLDGVKAFVSEWQTSGKNAALEYAKIQGDGSELTRDSARAAQTLNSALRSLNTSWQKFANQELAGPVRELANALNGLQPGTVERWLKIGTYVAGAMGGLILARKAFGWYEFGRDILTGGKGKGGRPGMGGLGGSGGPIPVYVVNKHLSMLPGQGWGFPGGGEGAPGGSAGRVAKIGKAAGAVGLRTAGVVGLPLITALVARPIGKALAEREASSSSTRRLQELLSRQMVMGGGPSSFQAQTIAKELQRRGALDGTIHVVIEGDAPARVKEVRSAPGLKLNVDSGLTMRSP